MRYSAGFVIGVWKAPFVFDKFDEDDKDFFAIANAVNYQLS